MNELTPAMLGEMWTMHKAGRTPEEPFLEAVQKFMVLHQDLHDWWDRLAADPGTAVVDGERNVLVHVAMDATTERALRENAPQGVLEAYGHLIAAGVGEGEAFHVISAAMEHEFLISAAGGREMELENFLKRAQEYVAQTLRSRPGAGSPGPQE